MDGFSPTYKHVMPGCSQGNTVWMLRDFASFRGWQGNASEATRLRDLASGLSAETMSKMYTVNKDGHGYFNIIFPPGAEPGHLTVMEMRHVVDFFSVTFGLCGITQPESSLCDFSSEVRRELASWFRAESVTSTWIRATSPLCNCSNSWSVRLNDSEALPPGGAKSPATGRSPSARAAHQPQSDPRGFPAYSTCAAGRPDHGSELLFGIRDNGKYGAANV